MDTSYIYTNTSDVQKEAIETVDQNLQIIACAGSGKTSTIVKRIINILRDENVDPENIVAFTFTEKAASDMKSKIYDLHEKVFGHTTGLAEMYVGTIHGYCMNLVKEYNPKYSNYTVLNDVQTQLFIKRYHRNVGLELVEYTTNEGVTRPLYNTDAKVFKNLMALLREGETVRTSDNENLFEALDQYEALLNMHKYFDYTSIMETAISVIRSNPDAQRDLHEKVRFLTVDEYQDINPMQEELIKLIHSYGANICVVGDDDQNIYSWRGSDSQYILKFETNYPNVVKKRLESNYRSSEAITDLAEYAISFNNPETIEEEIAAAEGSYRRAKKPEKKAKQLYKIQCYQKDIGRLKKTMKSAEFVEAEKGDVYIHDFNESSQTPSSSEIDFIVKTISELKGKEFSSNSESYGLTYGDMAILAGSVKRFPQEFIDKLNEAHIAYVIEGVKNFFESAQCKLVVCLFNFLNNRTISNKTQLEISLSDEFEYLSQNDINSIVGEFSKIDLNSYRDLSEFNLQELYLQFLAMTKTLSKGTEPQKYNYSKFTEVINDFEVVYLTTTPRVRVREFCKFLEKDASDFYPEGMLSKNYSETLNCVRIMTYHQAKGLEFPVVFLPFLTENHHFPTRKPGGVSVMKILDGTLDKSKYENTPAKLRRLFYVGVTRSKKFLFLTRAKYGRSNTTSDVFVKAKNYKPDYYQVASDYSQRPTSSDVKPASTDELALDFSTISSFFECPKRFYYGSVLGIAAPLSVRMGYGQSIHTILEDIHKNYKEYGEFDPDTVQGIVDKHFHLPYAARDLTLNMREKATLELTKYINTNKHAFGNIEYVEKPIEFRIGDNILFSGRIDLVINNTDGSVRIIDFKSKFDVALASTEERQLMTYALGYEKLTGKAPDYVEIYNIDQGAPLAPIPVTKEAMQQVTQDITILEQIIDQNKFDKAIASCSYNKELCESMKCPYAHICKGDA